MKINQPKEMICIVCPIGCHLEIIPVKNPDQPFQVTGNKCKRGIDYGIKELTCPERILPTTVKLKNAFLKRLPVRTEQAIPRQLIFDCMQIINQVEVTAPVHMGEIVIKNINNTGVNLIATRSIEALNSH